MVITVALFEPNARGIRGFGKLRRPPHLRLIPESEALAAERWP